MSRRRPGSLHRSAWLLGLAAALAGCTGGDVPLAPNALVAEARIADYPRATHSSLPVAEGEHAFADRCGIEAVQGATVTEAMPDGSLHVDLPGTASGWAFPPDEAPGIPDAWLRWRPMGEGTAAEFPIVLHYARPDVVAARANAKAAFAGFTATPVSGLAAGTYDVQVVFASEAGRWVCTQARRVHVR